MALNLCYTIWRFSSGGTNCPGGITYGQRTSKKCKMIRSLFLLIQINIHSSFIFPPRGHPLWTKRFASWIDQLDIFVQNLKDKLDSTQKETAAWKAKYNIKTQEEMDASSRQ
jgi:hypothetical protein